MLARAMMMRWKGERLVAQEGKHVVSQNEERISQEVSDWILQHRDDAVSLVSDLVQIPSVNHPPRGEEAAYQRHMADWLDREGAVVDCYELSEVKGLTDHPAYMEGQDYANRPNVVGTFAGQGGGRSLLFSGHADTVYEGVETWTHPPFSGVVEQGRVYGRGAYDMKGGVAAAMMAVKCLRALGYTFRGDVHIESVVDEEHGGANGSLAARLHGPAADMAIIPEPSNLAICPAHIGGGIWKATFEGKSGIGFAGEELVSALDATVSFAHLIMAFNAEWMVKLKPPKWWEGKPPLNATVLSIVSGDVQRKLQEKVPDHGEVTFWIEGYPGMTGEELLQALLSFYERKKDDYPALTQSPPQIIPLIRYLSASEMRASEQTDRFLQAVQTTGRRIVGDSANTLEGTPFACDGFMFNLHSSTPALVLGPEGANAHAADEYLDIDSYLTLIEWYAAIIVEWCGVEEARA